MPYYIVHGETKKATIENMFEPPLHYQLFARLASGVELTNEERGNIPNILRVGKSNIGKKIPDIIGKNSGPFCISEILKEQLEKLEPGAHEYFPVVVINKKSVELGKYYYVHITKSIDALVLDKTVFLGGKSGKKGAQESNYKLSIVWGGICVLDNEKIKGSHLWRGGEKMNYSYFCSDELRDYIVENKMIGWSFYKCDIE